MILCTRYLPTQELNSSQDKVTSTKGKNLESATASRLEEETPCRRPITGHNYRIPWHLMSHAFYSLHNS